MIIKEWFENKMKSEMNGGFIEDINGIEKETEKAVMLNITWAYGSDVEKNITKWVPKCAVMSDEEYEEEEQRREEQIEKGIKYNETLRNFAKANGIKGVRKGMRTVTIINKIKEAGLEVPEK